MMQAIYIILCVVTMYAVFRVQWERYLSGPCSPFCIYNVIAFCMGWEAIDAGLFGAPGFPATRWFLIPALACAMGWEAWVDARKRRPERRCR